MISIGTYVRFKADETGGAWGEVIGRSGDTYWVECFDKTFEVERNKLRPMTFVDYIKIRIDEMNNSRGSFD
jgi:hypothetical protein